MKREASPALPRRVTEGSRKRTAGPCSSMNSERSRCLRRTGCCALSNMARSPVSAHRSRSASMFASSQPPTRSLPSQVDKGRFRADLLDRLSFEVITLPPLRAREGDIPLLSEHFGRRMSAELEWPNWPGFTPRALAQLEAYPWPGNVRELRNVTERAVYRHEDPERPIDEIVFDPFHSPWAPTASAGTFACRRAVRRRPTRRANRASVASVTQASPPPASTSDFRSAVSDYERQLLEEALRRNRFNQRATAPP